MAHTSGLQGNHQATKNEDNGHVADDPLMRDEHRRRYWLFMAAARCCSPGAAHGRAHAAAARAELVRGRRWAYSSLVLTFVTSQPRTSLAMVLVIWVVVTVVLTLLELEYSRMLSTSSNF
jgi:hypothetical protein